MLIYLFDDASLILLINLYHYYIITLFILISLSIYNSFFNGKNIMNVW